MSFTIPTTAVEQRVRNLLKKVGIENPETELPELVRIFQRLYRLREDGVPGPVTTDVLEAAPPDSVRRYCAVPDRAGQACVWKNPARPLPIAWRIGARQNNGMIQGITPELLAAVYTAAWNAWARVANIAPRQTANASEAWVVMGSGRIDGPNGTLAWSYLPCAQIDEQLEQRYDVGEPWDTTIIGTPTAQRVSLLAVATHEIGHALGLDHGGSGLMAPYYDPSKLAPQAGYDIDQMVARYGPPSGVVPPVDPPAPPVDPPAGTPDVIIEFNGQSFSAKQVTIRGKQAQG